MKIVKQGEKADRSVSIKGDLVTRQHVTLNKPTKSEYALTWAFDFSDVTREELLTVASRAIVIALRPEFKAASASELESWDNRTFSVREYLDSERAKVDDVEKARRILGKLTPEQREAILAQMSE
jgi:hypothetical protein